MEEINIPLCNQVQIYSFETNAFYTDEEYNIDFELNMLRRNKTLLTKEIELITHYRDGEIVKDKVVRKICNLSRAFDNSSSADESHHLTEEKKIKNILLGVRIQNNLNPPFDILDVDNENILEDLEEEKKEVQKDIKKLEDKFTDTLIKHNSIRTARAAHLNHKNIISIFDSSLTRTLNMEYDKLNDGLIVVRVFYFKIAKDIVSNGFICNGEKYIYLSSSAGQIRQKKMVFIKESLWKQHHNTLLCGLSMDKINAKGGINRNKYLAYLSLCNSATDLWEDFDMSKAIVVEDFETQVNGEVDFFDDKTYEITRQVMDVPITHSDGSGIMLPSMCSKNRMFRAPWIKGLLSPFEFIEFIKLNNGSTKIKDIYGKEYDVIDDDIKVIFTKSQFKMHKYFHNWQEYLDCYSKYGCTAGYCNEEPDYIGSARLNYQMLQTLTDITDEELNKLSYTTNKKIKNLSTDLKTVMEVFKADEINKNSTYLQQAINLYPEMLNDVYTKEKLKLLKASIVKDARAGKLSLNSKYTFILPDLYAFCEYLFLGIEKPMGLLKNGEVYCSLFPKDNELDCLRSPHLDNAHAVRKNVIDDNKNKWFISKGLYTSCNDLISKMLQFDVDGDTALVCSDRLLIEIAKRNTKGDVPMYYHMAQANANPIDNKKLFDGLTLAFTSGNIGVPSNDITKMWNGDDIDTRLIKILTAEVNFVIDYAKTLYRPIRPAYIKEKLRKLSKMKAPHFFKFAKDKKDTQVEPINNSTVNRLYKIIKPGRMSFAFENCNFDYRMLMKNPNIDVSAYEKICKIYDLFRMSRYNLSANTQQAINKRESNFRHRREQFIEYFRDVNIIADVLVKYLYEDGKNSKYKDILWYCFGDVLVENLKCNLESKYFDCSKCNKKFYAEYHNQRLCKKCSVYKPIGVKKLVCVDCGMEFEVEGKVKKQVRCRDCQKKKNREWRMKNYYKKEM